MPSLARLVRSLALATLTLAPLAARADVPPDGAEECSGKSAGAACELHGTAGHCRETTCSRVRPDGEVTYPCTLCEADPAEARTSSSPTATGKSSCASAPDAGLVGLVMTLGLVARRRLTARSAGPRSAA